LAGYTRQALANIQNNSTADADDINDEFNQVQAAFNNATGHTHDGTSGEGVPITKVGPVQDVVVTASVMRPKTDATLDLGTSLLQFKDGYFSGTVDAGAFVAPSVTITGGTITGITDLAVADGGTGSSTAAGALVNLGLTATAAELNILDGATLTVTELNYVDGVTSALQTQLDAKQATITGGATSIASSNLTASRVLVSDASGKVDVSALISPTELNYLNNVSSNIQDQIDTKQATITGAASSVVTANLDASIVVVSSAGGKIGNSSTTTTELGYLNSVTSDIQTQINGKQTIVTGADQVGSIGLFMVKSGARGSVIAHGDAIAGSSLEWANTSGSTSSTATPTGSWMCMGRIPASGTDANSVSLFMRTA